MDLRANMTLSKAFSEEMNILGRKFTVSPERGTASTDMGMKTDDPLLWLLYSSF